MTLVRERRRCRLGSSMALPALVVVRLAMGCAPDEDGSDEGVVESAHLRITTSEDKPICAGTPLLLEQEVVRIAEALELPLWPEDEKLEVRFGAESVSDLCSEIELDIIDGCVDEVDSHFVVAATEVAYISSHELVHAVRARNLSLGHPLFEEGLAQVLSGSDGFPIYVTYPHGDPHHDLAELLAEPKTVTSHYIAGQSFVSWLWETHGRSTLMSFVNDPRMSDDQAVLALFEERFGQSVTEAEQAWSVDDRPHPIWGAPCIPERTYSLADGPIEISGDLDCSEPTVYGASYFMAVWPMCLEIPSTTRVRISLEADHGRLSVQAHEPCEAGPAGAEAYRSKYLDAGETLEEDITGCRHRMSFSSQEPGFPPTPYVIRIEELES